MEQLCYVFGFALGMLTMWLITRKRKAQYMSVSLFNGRILIYKRNFVKVPNWGEAGRYDSTNNHYELVVERQ